MTSWPTFHGPLTSDFGQIIKFKIFVQGRISRLIHGSKLIFHMRMHLHEISRIIQEPWPHVLYFIVCWLQTLANFPWLRFLSFWWTNVITGIGSMWCSDLPHNMYMGQLPTLHGPVILSYILRTFWWRNVVLKILIQCDITFDLQIYV